MTCNPAHTAQSAGRTAVEPFAFGAPALVQGFGAWAALWATPWRAAAIVAEEALREHGPHRG